MWNATLWVLGVGVVLFVLDRLLLRMESRGWIYYRRTKAGRGASTYHLLEWNAAFDPTMKQVQEEMVREERREDEAGDPLRTSDATESGGRVEAEPHEPTPAEELGAQREGLGAALRWIVDRFEEARAPFQAVGGLAVAAYGGTRPLVDLDFYVPEECLSRLLPGLELFLTRPLSELRGSEWRLRFLQGEFGGWRFEIAVAEGARFRNRATQEWEDQAVDFHASVLRRVAGVPIHVMPLRQLLEYKEKLGREVDALDVKDLRGRYPSSATR